MTAYLTIKPILMAAAIIGAGSVFYTRARRLVQLMKSVPGRSSVALDRMGEGIKVLFSDGLADRGSAVEVKDIAELVDAATS